MININVVCVGNLKEDYWQQAVKEYQKRISAFAKINVVEVKESVMATAKKIFCLQRVWRQKNLKHTKKDIVLHLK